MLLVRLATVAPLMLVQYSRMIWPLPRLGSSTIQLNETEVTCPASLTSMVLR